MKAPVALGACLVLVASAAWADVAPPDTSECQSRKAGDPCTGGTCVVETCYRRDYTNWDQDASPMPPSVPYDCLVCIAQPTATGTVTGTGTTTTDTKDDDSGCSVGGSAARSLGPWLLAGLFGAAVMLIRRRRGK